MGSDVYYSHSCAQFQMGESGLFACRPWRKPRAIRSLIWLNIIVLSRTEELAEESVHVCAKSAEQGKKSCGSCSGFCCAVKCRIHLECVKVKCVKGQDGSTRCHIVPHCNTIIFGPCLDATIINSWFSLSFKRCVPADTCKQKDLVELSV